MGRGEKMENGIMKKRMKDIRKREREGKYSKARREKMGMRK